MKIIIQRRELALAVFIDYKMTTEAQLVEIYKKLLKFLK